MKAYLIPDQLTFGFFPWAAFVAFGMSAGSIIRLARKDQLDRVMQWAALVGLVLIVAARYCSELPYSLYARIRVLAEQPVADSDQAGRDPAGPDGRLSVDPVRRGARLELDPPVRDHLTAGLLGPHGAGLWALALLLEGEPYSRRRQPWRPWASSCSCWALSVVKTNWRNWRLGAADVRLSLLRPAPSTRRLGSLGAPPDPASVVMSENDMRILLIEDEKRIADFIARGLEEIGYSVDIGGERPGGALQGSPTPPTT